VDVGDHCLDILLSTTALSATATLTPMSCTYTLGLRHILFILSVLVQLLAVR
jgi:hypothetical protein